MSKQHHLDDYANAVVPANYQFPTYYFSSTQDVIDYRMGVGSAARYARYDNRVWQHVEQQMAHLDGCDDAAVFPCGMSAISNTLMNLVRKVVIIVYMGKECAMSAPCARKCCQIRHFHLAGRLRHGR
ncbi:MAG: PLP-dependent transferase [Azonexus sp.]